MKLRRIVLVTFMLASSSTMAEDLKVCDFNKVEGTCSAEFTLNKQTNEYQIPRMGLAGQSRFKSTTRRTLIS